jgi:predicted phage-related endonuclease
MESGTLTKEEIQRRVGSKGLGGSDMAKVLGVSRWGGPLDVWAQKLELVPKPEQRPEMEFGGIMEPKIAQWYSSAYGERLRRPGFVRMASPMSWAIGFIDRQIVGSDRVIEIKTSLRRDGWGQPGGNQIPPDAYIQTQHYIWIVNAPDAHVVALIAGRWPPSVYMIERDEEMIEMIRTEGERFWTQFVLTGDPPPPDGSNACAEYLKRRWPDPQPGKVVVATMEDYHAAADLREAKIELKRQEEAVRLLENRIKARIGDFEEIAGDGWRATWRATRPYEKTDYEKVAAQLAAKWSGEMVDQMVRDATTLAGGHRQFRVTFDEEEA